VRQYLLKIEILLLLILITGCSSYDMLLLNRRIKIEKHEGYDIIFDYEKTGGPAKKNTDRTSHPFKTERYFKGKNYPGVPGTITGRGIIEATRGNYREAEFLFHETESLLSDGSSQNNLAVVYEASGRYSEAFSMYSKAILIAPEEKVFRSNFILFLNQNYKETTEQVKKIRR
jgi:tetratricopeptide (TPR) repeat protein